MNKILITLFISMFLPVYACPVDSDKPCTGENQDTQNQIYDQGCMFGV